MHNNDRAIVPHQNGEITPRQRAPVTRQPVTHVSVQRIHRPSHYIPVATSHPKPVTGLWEVVQAFLVGGLMVIGFSILALAVVHLGNAVYWQGERMHQRVNSGYLGGSWNE